MTGWWRLIPSWETVAILVILVIVCLGFAACQPTGDNRCEQPDIRPWAYIEAAGWTLDCDPPFPGVAGDGRTVSGWADFRSNTVYVWPDNASTERLLTKTLFHEAGHAVGFRDEWLADVWAWCRMTTEQKDGLGFLAPYPQKSDCRKVGVRVQE